MHESKILAKALRWSRSGYSCLIIVALGAIVSISIVYLINIFLSF